MRARATSPTRSSIGCRRRRSRRASDAATTAAGRGRMLLQYRGGPGMLAWAFHRISGVAIWAFVLLHVLEIWPRGATPPLSDDVLRVSASPIGGVGVTLLGAALLRHALIGLR